MKAIFTILVVFLIFNVSMSQTPTWVWAKSYGGTDNEFATGCAVDNNGYVYVTANYWYSTFYVDTVLLTPIGESNWFVTKYDDYGNMLWLKGPINTTEAYSHCIKTDNLNNVIASGVYYDYLVFDSTVLMNESLSAFLVKYDQNGILKWARSFGGDTSSSVDGDICDVGIDASDNIYLTSSYNGTEMSFDTENIDNVGLGDIFIAKINPDGDAMWAKSFGGASWDEALGIVTNEDGTSVIVGDYESNPITFDSYNLTNNGNHDAFITKLDSSGNVLWARKVGGVGKETFNDAVIGTDGSVYAIGEFSSPSITLGAFTLNSNGSSDIMVIKYDAIGNIVWVKSFGGSDIEWSKAIQIHQNNDIIITGEYKSSSISFDSFVLSNIGGTDVFIASCKSDGSVKWAKSYGDLYDDSAFDLAIDNTGYGCVYAAGFYGSPVINFDAIQVVNDNPSNLDMYLAKLGGTQALNEISENTSIAVYPNPAKDVIRVVNPEHNCDISIEIIDISGKTIMNLSVKANEDFPISKIDAGFYLMRIYDGQQIKQVKFVKD